MKNWLTALALLLLGTAIPAVLFLVSAPPRGASIQLVPAPTPALIQVQVDGAVERPGVYALPRDSRVQDAIQAAGGLTADADSTKVNLAAHLKDGEKLSFREIGAQPTTPPAGSTRSEQVTTEDSAPSSPININTASLDELMQLPGIGESKANSIIAYREAHGGFKTIAELDNVSGIGPSILEGLKDLVSVE